MSESIDDLAAAVNDLVGVDVHANDDKVPAGQRPCPICGRHMRVEAHRSVSLDVCVEHGVWLDNGELNAILSQASRRRTAAVQSQIKEAKRSGKVSGALFGVWSLLFD